MSAVVQKPPTLYWISGSPPSWRVMLALQAKRVEYESVRLDSGKKEHKSAAYLAINPRGQVPTFVHEGVVVRESIAILAYIEKQWPEPPLFGTSSREHAAIWQDVMDFESNLRPSVATVARIIFNRLQQEQAAALAESAAVIDRELALYDRRLAHVPYLIGSSVSAADFVLYPGLRWLARAIERSADELSTPGLAQVLASKTSVNQWMRRIEQTPGFEATFPPHWRTGS